MNSGALGALQQCLHWFGIPSLFFMFIFDEVPCYFLLPAGSMCLRVVIVNMKTMRPPVIGSEGSIGPDFKIDNHYVNNLSINHFIISNLVMN